MDVVALGRTGLVGGALVLDGALGRAQASAPVCLGSRHPGRAPRLDLFPTGREVPPKFLRYSDDLGVTMGTRRVPVDTKPSCKLCSEGGLVDAAGRLLLGEEVAAVECPPRTVGAANLGRDEQVSVQLGIEGPAGAVDVGGDEQPVAVERNTPPLPDRENAACDSR